MSKIEWTDITWNPVTGCTKVSPGCKNCYAERMAARCKAMGLEKYARGFDVVTHPYVLDEPMRIRKHKRIFVNSMSDLFHPDIDDDFIDDVFDVMRGAVQHSFQVLTKRPERMRDYVNAHQSPPAPNIWLGTSVEQRRWLSRVDVLRDTEAHVRFLSLEPLLEDLGEIDLDDIHWVIAGGESGPGARRIDTDWVRAIRDRCADSDVPFFFKQWGGTNKSKTGRVLDERTYDAMPEAYVGQQTG